MTKGQDFMKNLTVLLLKYISKKKMSGSENSDIPPKGQEAASKQFLQKNYDSNGSEKEEKKIMEQENKMKEMQSKITVLEKSNMDLMHALEKKNHEYQELEKKYLDLFNIVDGIRKQLDTLCPSKTIVSKDKKMP